MEIERQSTRRRSALSTEGDRAPRSTKECGQSHLLNACCGIIRVRFSPACHNYRFRLCKSDVSCAESAEGEVLVDMEDDLNGC
jgi:hypothetical protein